VPSGDPLQALAKPAVREPDAYERRYMSDHGAALFRTKRAAPAWLRRLTGGSVLIGLGLAITPAWPAAVVLLPAGFAAWALFSVLRVSVCERRVLVQYATVTAEIPIAAIERAEAISRDRGFGARRSGGGRSLDDQQIICMPGDRGAALRITWRDGDTPRVTVVGIPDPEPAIAAIAAAIRALRSAE
jgi:hypothetical protein